MKVNLLTLLLVFSMVASVHAQVGENTSLFVQDSLKLISSQFKFTEGASVDKMGNVFFTDQPSNQIWKYGIDGKLSLFLANAGRSNGTYFDKKGNLIACADEHNEIWSISPKGKVKLLYKNPIGANLNGPNDVWLDAKGGMYFTDPYYQRAYWIRQKPDIKGEKVYYLPKGKNNIITVDSDLVRPNGIVGTPNGKILYVADALSAKIYQYAIQADATLSNRKLFVAQRSDGMTLDERGNLYLTGKNGVAIYSSTGEHIGTIKIPEPHTANLCFGGKNKDILFITASKSVYVLKMNVKGVE
ncbi:SMP-30/gluconolactonase/LRE family protein [Pedobacter sp. Du54]|uniref:SMP-30/gluconolactonase/LRE family protein n=1 Tax=Pedobacter anseongensis TaxID=3133439 RepID=UPI0030A5A182